MLASDAHMHSNPIKGMGAATVSKKFRATGGWFAALIMLPSWDYGDIATNLDTYLKYVNVHVMECRQARENGLNVKCFAGFHPAEIDRLLDRGLEPLKVLEYGVKVVDELYSMCEKGIIDGVGELGRQHYKTSTVAHVIASRILDYALVKTRDTGCLTQLHLENVRSFTAWDISDRVTRLGVSDQVLVHHARAGVAEETLSRKLWASSPAIRGSLQRVLERSPSLETLLIESDFIDDPKRPGVVVEPWKIPSNVLTSVEAAGLDKDVLYKLFVDNIVRFFGVEPP